MEPYFQSMARVEAMAWGPNAQPPATCARASLPGVEIFVDLQDFIDVDAEIARKTKEQHRIAALIAGKEQKLANQRFVSRAPAAVVERERTSLTQLAEQLASVEAALAELRKGTE
jgi:valyl-tRNA synthetase